MTEPNSGSGLDQSELIVPPAATVEQRKKPQEESDLDIPSFLLKQETATPESTDSSSVATPAPTTDSSVAPTAIVEDEFDIPSFLRRTKPAERTGVPDAPTGFTATVVNQTTPTPIATPKPVDALTTPPGSTAPSTSMSPVKPVVTSTPSEPSLLTPGGLSEDEKSDVRDELNTALHDKDHTTINRLMGKYGFYVIRSLDTDYDCTVGPDGRFNFDKKAPTPTPPSPAATTAPIAPAPSVDSTPPEQLGPESSLLDPATAASLATAEARLDRISGLLRRDDRIDRANLELGEKTVREALKREGIGMLLSITSFITNIGGLSDSATSGMRIARAISSIPLYGMIAKKVGGDFLLKQEQAQTIAKTSFILDKYKDPATGEIRPDAKLTVEDKHALHATIVDQLAFYQKGIIAPKATLEKRDPSADSEKAGKLERLKAVGRNFREWSKTPDGVKFMKKSAFYASPLIISTLAATGLFLGAGAVSAGLMIAAKGLGVATTGYSMYERAGRINKTINSKDELTNQAQEELGRITTLVSRYEELLSTNDDIKWSKDSNGIVDSETLTKALLNNSDQSLKSMQRRDRNLWIGGAVGAAAFYAMMEMIHPNSAHAANEAIKHGIEKHAAGAGVGAGAAAGALQNGSQPGIPGEPTQNTGPSPLTPGQPTGAPQAGEAPVSAGAPTPVAPDAALSADTPSAAGTAGQPGTTTPVSPIGVAGRPGAMTNEGLATTVYDKDHVPAGISSRPISPGGNPENITASTTIPEINHGVLTPDMTKTAGIEYKEPNGQTVVNLQLNHEAGGKPEVFRIWENETTHERFVLINKADLYGDGKPIPMSSYAIKVPIGAEGTPISVDNRYGQLVSLDHPDQTFALSDPSEAGGSPKITAADPSSSTIFEFSNKQEHFQQQLAAHPGNTEFQDAWTRYNANESKNIHGSDWHETVARRGILAPIDPDKSIIDETQIRFNGKDYVGDWTTKTGEKVELVFTPNTAPASLEKLTANTGGNVQLANQIYEHFGSNAFAFEDRSAPGAPSSFSLDSIQMYSRDKQYIEKIVDDLYNRSTTFAHGKKPDEETIDALVLLINKEHTGRVDANVLYTMFDMKKPFINSNQFKIDSADQISAFTKKINDTINDPKILRHGINRIWDTQYLRLRDILNGTFGAVDYIRVGTPTEGNLKLETVNVILKNGGEKQLIFPVDSVMSYIKTAPEPK